MREGCSPSLAHWQRAAVVYSESWCRSLRVILLACNRTHCICVALALHICWPRIPCSLVSVMAACIADAMSHSKHHMPVAFEHVIIALALHQVPMLHGLLSWVAGKQLGHISWHIHEICKSDSAEPMIEARTAWNSSCSPSSCSQTSHDEMD